MFWRGARDRAVCRRRKRESWPRRTSCTSSPQRRLPNGQTQFIFEAEAKKILEAEVIEPRRKRAVHHRPSSPLGAIDFNERQAARSSAASSMLRAATVALRMLPVSSGREAGEWDRRKIPLCRHF